MTQKVPSPVFLNLLRIHLPVTAVLSITHRVSGVVLGLAIPVVIYGLHLSVQGPSEYVELLGWLGQRPVRIVLLFVLWAFAHHALAGIRYLFIDVDIGVEKRAAQNSAWVVLALSVSVLMVLAAALL